MTKKTLLIAGAALLVLIGVGAGVFWYWMSQPLYEPGMVRSGQNLRAPLRPPAQANEPGLWNVESDIRLHHFAVGSGTTNVLVVHGGPGQPSRSPWPGLQPLTDEYRFVYYDQRGCGRSSRPIDKFTSSNFYENLKTLDRTLGLGAQIADIERIRTILGQEQLILIGHSFGGFLASMYAAEFPERVKALILVAPADVLVMPQQGAGFYEEIGRRLPPPMRSAYAEFLKRYLDFGSIFAKSEAELQSLNGEFGKYYFAAAGSTAGTMPAPTDANAGGGWMVQAMYFSMGRRHDYRAALRHVKSPTLVIHGGLDLQPESASRAYVEALPHAMLQVLPKAGHFAFLEPSADFSTAVGRFLADLK